MEIFAETIDDLLIEVLEKLLSQKSSILTTRGQTKEIIGTTLTLDDPLSRISLSETKGTIFSALGELLWYLSGDNKLDFIKYYIKDYSKESEDGETIHGGYGPRLFSCKGAESKQVGYIIEVLRNKPNTRRAIIPIIEVNDIACQRIEIPCTSTLQFFIRDKKLIMHTCMRSNDAFRGLPHDIFAFTMLQEIIAKTLGLDLGSYIHTVGSLHIYEKEIKRIKGYIDEGFQSTLIKMPSMPEGDPWKDIRKLLEFEELCRNDKFKIKEIGKIEQGYWGDIKRLLLVYNMIKNDKKESIKAILGLFNNDIYKPYIMKRINI